MKPLITLAIETSADETGVAILESKNLYEHTLITSLVSSQIRLHKTYGGIVPSLAAREHEKNLPILVKKALAIGKRKDKLPRHIAYTQTPGLAPALLIGQTFAKTLAWALGIKAKGTNHLRGHIVSSFLAQGSFAIPQDLFPAIALVVSGGHTQLYVLESFTKSTLLGQTKDDAFGEAFDKVARLLGYPYPGGPHIERLAKKAQAKNAEIAFPSPMLESNDYDFSFSGLKTAVRYFLEKQGEKAGHVDFIAQTAKAFQEAALKPVVGKTKRAIEHYSAKTLLVGGGGCANQKLRQDLKTLIEQYGGDVSLWLPKKEFTGDNAAMIALAANLEYLT